MYLKANIVSWIYTFKIVGEVVLIYFDTWLLFWLVEPPVSLLIGSQKSRAKTNAYHLPSKFDTQLLSWYHVHFNEIV